MFNLHNNFIIGRLYANKIGCEVCTRSVTIIRIDIKTIYYRDFIFCCYWAIH